MQQDTGKIPVLKQILEHVQHLGMKQRRRRKLARRRCARENENSRTDDRPDTKGRERPGAQRLRQTMAGLSESEISLSMDFLAKSWLARKASLN
jgi:hypothetical protein